MVDWCLDASWEFKQQKILFGSKLLLKPCLVNWIWLMLRLGVTSRHTSAPNFRLICSQKVFQAKRLAVWGKHYTKTAIWFKIVELFDRWFEFLQEMYCSGLWLAVSGDTVSVQVGDTRECGGEWAVRNWIGVCNRQWPPAMEVRGAFKFYGILIFFSGNGSR